MNNETEPNFDDLDESDQIPKPRPSILFVPPSKKHFFGAVNVCLACLLVSLGHWNRPEADLFSASGQLVFGEGQYWRLLTAVFAHSDLRHWMSNTPLLVVFGWFLRSYFGLLAFPGLALIFGALTNLVTLVYYPPELRLLGASGMVYAMLGLWMTLYVSHETRYSWPMRIFRALAVSIALLFPTTFHPTTSYLAHGAGLVIGLVGGLLCYPWLRRDPE